jgi:S-DNA-T family DNA segregation ATPase FtsK/SpoIIIE
VHTLTLTGTAGGLGALVWLDRAGVLVGSWRALAAGAVGIVASAGFLSLLQPDLTLGETSLAVVSAGGDLGDLFSSSAIGILAWLGVIVAAVSLAWPRSVLDLLQSTPGALATAWGWHLPHKAFNGLRALIEFAFPTSAPPDERPSHMPPSWLPQEDEDAPSPVSAAAPEPARPVAVEADLKQAPLPMYWKPGDDDEDTDEPSARASSPASTWLLPPMDVLVSAAPADETARPDNALRANLIVETLASFGVDARVSQYHEGPVVTQFDVEPGWEVKSRQLTERDKDGKIIFDKDGRPKTRLEEVSRTRVRVNQITNLANDLALALAAPSMAPRGGSNTTRRS